MTSVEILCGEIGKCWKWTGKKTALMENVKPAPPEKMTREQSGGLGWKQRI